jgi:tetratricopeptide (TPR) repeat protein
MAIFGLGKKEEDPAVFVAKKQYKKAIEAYRKILEKAPNDTNARLRLADALAFDNQIPDAVKQYRKVATDFAEKGFLLKAIGVNKKIVKLDPSSKDVHKNLSALYEEKGLLASKVTARRAGFTAPAAPQPEAGSAPAPGPGGPKEAEAVPVEAAHAEAAQEEMAADLAPDLASAEEAPPSFEDLAASLDMTPEDVESISAQQAHAAREISHERIPLFSDFTAEEFAEVAHQMSLETFEKDAAIVREGDPGDAMYVLISGEVRVVMKTKEGPEMELAVLKEGDFFGEGSLLTGKPRTATIIATTETEALKLDKIHLEEITAKHPRVLKVLNEFLMQRVQSTIKHLKEARKK